MRIRIQASITKKGVGALMMHDALAVSKNMYSDAARRGAYSHANAALHRIDPCGYPQSTQTLEVVLHPFHGKFSRHSDFSQGSSQYQQDLSGIPVVSYESVKS